MNNKKKVITNASWIIGCRIVQAILSLIIGMLTARYLGPANYGLINYASSVVTFFVPVTYLGLNSILVQEIVKKPDLEGELLGTSITLSIISAFLCILSVSVFSVIANKGEKITIIVCILYSLSLVFQAVDLIQYWFQAKLISKYNSVVMLVAYIVVSVYKVWLLVSRKSVIWFSVSNVIDYIIIAFFLVVIYRKLGGKPFSFSFAMGKRLLSRSKYYIISGLMIAVFTQTDKIMLKLMMDDASTGYYSAAVACAGVTSFVFTAIIDSLRPSIFASVKQGKKIFEDRIVQLYSIIIFISFLQSVLMTAFSDIVVKFLFGSQYELTSGVLKVVVWYTTFSYIGAASGIWMLVEEKQKYLLSANLYGALANIVFNALLIPVWGVYGAALASIITQFFTNICIGFFVRPLRHNIGLIVRALHPRVFISVIRMVVK